MRCIIQRCIMRSKDRCASRARNWGGLRHWMAHDSGDLGFRNRVECGTICGTRSVIRVNSRDIIITTTGCGYSFRDNTSGMRCVLIVHGQMMNRYVPNLSVWCIWQLSRIPAGILDILDCWIHPRTGYSVSIILIMLQAWNSRGSMMKVRSRSSREDRIHPSCLRVI